MDYFKDRHLELTSAGIEEFLGAIEDILWSTGEGWSDKQAISSLRVALRNMRGKGAKLALDAVIGPMEKWEQACSNLRELVRRNAPDADIRRIMTVLHSKRSDGEEISEYLVRFHSLMTTFGHVLPYLEEVEAIVNRSRTEGSMEEEDIKKSDLLVTALGAMNDEGKFDITKVSEREAQILKVLKQEEERSETLLVKY